jgi:ABC-type nitrate/sulfonate/bicarbonate transport system permease component
VTATRSADAQEVVDALGTGAPVVAGAGRARREVMPSWVGGTIGAVILISVWEILALTVFHKVGSGVPTPTSVVSQLWTDLRYPKSNTFGLYGRNFGQTMREAATGFVVANLLAIILGVSFVQLPVVEKALLKIAIASYCLPIIAVGPILSFVMHGSQAKATLAGMLVFFPSLVGVVVGLRSADKNSLDLIKAAGGGSWAQLTKVRLKAALPSVFAAFQIAAPSAILGAIVGEYLGQQGNGLGIMMIDAQQSLAVSRTWGIALVCTLVAGFCYVIIGLIGRAVAPWAPRRGTR